MTTLGEGADLTQSPEQSPETEALTVEPAPESAVAAEEEQP